VDNQVDDLIKIRQLKPKSNAAQGEIEDEHDLNKATGTERFVAVFFFLFCSSTDLQAKTRMTKTLAPSWSASCS
jgi:hypothetical protein